MAKLKVIVTTTPSIDGWEIESYLSPISSHIVAGTGFFSDFAASFSDVFGGRSQTYQRQLSAINNEVIESLKNKATRLGANVIVGLHIDHDEISGKGKQMFMVTAYGTAVRATQTKVHKASSEKKPIIISSEELVISLKIQSIIAKCHEIPISLNEEEWNFITENQVREIASQVLESLQNSYLRCKQDNSSLDQAYLNRRQKYFLSLPSDISIKHLYDSIPKHDLLFPFISETVLQGDLIDFDLLAKLFSSGEFRVQKCALTLAQADKPYYSPDDIDSLSRLIDSIKSTFVVRGKHIEEKAMLSSNVKHKWLCDCGTKNDIDANRCSNCSRDTYGFLSNEPTPDKVISLIKNKIGVLTKIFS